LALFTLALPVSLIIHDVGSLIFDPATTKTLVRENLLNSKFVASVAKKTISQMLGGSEGQPNGSAEASASGNSDGLTLIVNETLADLSDADWEQITALTAPTALMDETLTQVLDSYTAWLDSNQPFPSLKLDLKVWKENTHNNAPQIMTILLDAVPGCSVEQVDTIASQNLQSSDGVIGALQGCRPPEPYYSAMIGNAPLLFDNLLRGTPDEIDLDLVTQGTNAPNELVSFKSSLVQVRAIVNWGWIIVSAIGLVAALLGARGLVSFLRWVGWPVLFAGALVVILGVGLQFFTLHFLDAAIGAPLAARDDAFGALGTAIAGGALDLVNKTVLLQGLVLSGLGTLAFYIATKMSRRATATGIPLNRKRIGL
ncbi:MAG TPA: hypothetical protein VLK33_00500, partial [Terriglobales bacterium]|nr:hypothetical protein [Terriglobales bacterium]